MSKTLDTLPEDIYTLLDRRVLHTPDPILLKEYGETASNSLARSFEQRANPRTKDKIWFSDLGENCPRKLWYKFNTEDKGEVLTGNTLFKFTYGDLIEDKVLYLAKEAGHTVEYEQERIEYYHEPTGITLSGRIDAVVDGVLIDVKSTSSYGYKKYTTEGLNAENDSFGYQYQLSGYFQLGMEMGYNTQDTGFLWIDKQNGHIAYTPITPLSRQDIEDEIQLVADTIREPTNRFNRLPTKPDGKSGNECLDIACSYCPFKQHCWSKAEGADEDLRTFLYSYGPKFLTKVVNEPRVMEAKSDE